jgi:replicative DNA helicase
VEPALKTSTPSSSVPRRWCWVPRATPEPSRRTAPSEWTSHLIDYLGQARAGGLAGVSTGLRDLDTITLGLSPGLYLLAAATGTGKTAIAAQIALPVAEQVGPVVFVSMELTGADLAVRFGIGDNQHSHGEARHRSTQSRAGAAVMDAIERLSRSRLHVVFGSRYTSAHVRGAVYVLSNAPPRGRHRTVSDTIQMGLPQIVTPDPQMRP